ncbi:MAG: hypothetical protein ABH826_05320 [Patescibacteria group bacterium]
MVQKNTAMGELKTSMNELMEFLQLNMVTKDDLKEALRDFVTKDEFNEFKEELKGFATKDELTAGFNKQKHEIFDYVDNKLLDFKGDLVALMRLESDKAGELIILLKKKRLLTLNEAKQILSMQPFPKLLN